MKPNNELMMNRITSVKASTKASLRASILTEIDLEKKPIVDN